MGWQTLHIQRCLAEIGDVQRFPSADHLVAYAGLALSEDQSGQARARRFLSWRGSARLRTSFYQAPWSPLT
jgi:transposase